MDFQTFSSSKEFQQLHPLKKQLIQELVRNNTHTSPEALLPKILSINTELSKRNLSFTPNETNLLINLLKSDMSPTDQQKIDILLGLFHHS